jgi:hypothetical protein
MELNNADIKALVDFARSLATELGYGIITWGYAPNEVGLRKLGYELGYEPEKGIATKAGAGNFVVRAIKHYYNIKFEVYLIQGDSSLLRVATRTVGYALEIEEAFAPGFIPATALCEREKNESELVADEYTKTICGLKKAVSQERQTLQMADNKEWRESASDVLADLTNWHDGRDVDIYGTACAIDDLFADENLTVKDLKEKWETVRVMRKAEPDNFRHQLIEAALKERAKMLPKWKRRLLLPLGML